MSKDLFEEKAKVWDSGSIRVDGAHKIAEAIQNEITLAPNMKIMDFGVGTGLLGFEIAKIVQEVVGVDSSKSMLDKLREKNSDTLFIRPLEIDITQNPIDEFFDGVVSSMTLHHVKDLEKFFQTIKNNLNENGFLAIADLETEDGTFHSDNEGVFHFGFDAQELCDIVKKCGYKNVKFQNINTIKKPHRDFGVFLLTATL